MHTPTYLVNLYSDDTLQSLIYSGSGDPDLHAKSPDWLKPDDLVVTMAVLPRYHIPVSAIKIAQVCKDGYLHSIVRFPADKRTVTCVVGSTRGTFGFNICKKDLVNK
jgi:hypothetical protein